MTAPFALPMHLFPLNFTRGVKLERKALQQHLANYIYPVLTLPNEVISEIFLQTLDASPSLVGRASPIYLGHICQKWRDIAQSTPSLWCTVAIRVFKYGAQNLLQLLEMWLARSRRCPLSITFIDQTGGQVVASRLLRAILQHRDRWETLDLYLSWDTIPDIVQGDLPLLRHLEVRLDDRLHGQAPTGTTGSARAFFGPKLTTVTLHGQEATMLRLPWGQLTTITIDQSLDRLVHILHSTTNVTHLSLQILPLEDSDLLDIIPSIPPLLHLRSISILKFWTNRQGAVHRKSETELLRRLTLPALRHLRLPAPTIPEVVYLIRRSQCPLDGLRIIMGATDYFPLMQSDDTIILEPSANENSDESDDSNE
ncbi:hypothetical protein B0H16DRAFT_1880919 [Mycena metata]|uniref:F-box domain-containing protein n=1 Tax=Mycena metata TaxID=1033252 RepID=A0AAD7NRT3_9AGAR|nr:hypothetical protein B0H16DRAFT_1880919 [Mycena metata]